MTPKTFCDGRAVLHAGDCLAVLERLPADSVDAIVCDPPYELSNDGKQSPNRVLLEFAFPKHAHVDANFCGGNELALLISKVLGLGCVGTLPGPSMTTQGKPSTRKGQPGISERA